MDDSQLAIKESDPYIEAISSIPGHQQPQETHDQSKEAKSDYTKIVEDLEHLGYKKIVYSPRIEIRATKGSVLVAASIVNENAFGRMRKFQDFYEVIKSLDYEKESMSLAFYCGSLALLDIVTKFFDDTTTRNVFPFRKATILYAPFLQNNFRASEHNPKVQRDRRRRIATGRNFVLSSSLSSEEFTLFLDADIIRFDHPDMLARFIHSGKDIVVPRVAKGGHPDYDRNSWRGNRIVPSETQLELMNQDKWDEADYEPRDVDGEIYHLGQQVEDIKDLPDSDEKRDLNYLVPLDSVGGAVLFTRSIVFKLGAIFPTYNAIGTSWVRKEGYDGIETEGLCYVALTLGFHCFAMPNLVAQHWA